MKKWRLKTDWMGFEKGYEPKELLWRLQFYKESIWICEVSSEHARLFPDIFEEVQVRWVPKQNLLYFFMYFNTASTDAYAVQSNVWIDIQQDHCRLHYNNVFKNIEQAERAAEYCRTSGKELLTALREFTDKEIEEGRLGPEEGK